MARKSTQAQPHSVPLADLTELFADMKSCMQQLESSILTAADGDTTLTFEQVCTLLRCKTSTLYKYMANGLPSHKPEGTNQLTFVLREIRAWQLSHSHDIATAVQRHHQQRNQ